MQFGTKKSGAMRPSLGRLETGKLYEVGIEAQGITDSKTTSEFLLTKLAEEYPELQVTWLSVCETYQTINFQFTMLKMSDAAGFQQPQRFFITALLAWLPTILTLLGIGVVAISIWDIIAGVPWYIWAALATGVFLFVFGPTISGMLQRKAPEYRAPVIVLPDRAR